MLRILGVMISRCGMVVLGILGHSALVLILIVGTELSGACTLAVRQTVILPDENIRYLEHTLL